MALGMKVVPDALQARTKRGVGHPHPRQGHDPVMRDLELRVKLAASQSVLREDQTRVGPKAARGAENPKNGIAQIAQGGVSELRDLRTIDARREHLAADHFGVEGRPSWQGSDKRPQARRLGEPPGERDAREPS